MTPQYLVSKALEVWNARNDWTYSLGGLGELGESPRIAKLYNYYYNSPARPTAMTLPYADWLVRYGRGRRCTDCNNLINYLLGYDTNKYSCWHFGQMERVAIDDLTLAPAGTVLIIPGKDPGTVSHVGLAIGGGEFIDMPHYNAGPRRGMIEGTLFKFAVYLPEVEYAQPDDMTVTVTDRVRYVGDRITREDFRVVLHYPDGTSAECTTFNYTPGMLTNTDCVVAIVYGDNELVRYAEVTAQKSGRFYAVMIPCADAVSALAVQEELIGEGFKDAAIINL